MAEAARTLGGARVDLLAVAEMVAPGAKVLDVGCGDGELLRLLAETRGVGHVDAQFHFSNHPLAPLVGGLVASAGARVKGELRSPAPAARLTTSGNGISFAA